MMTKQTKQTMIQAPTRVKLETMEEIKSLSKQTDLRIAEIVRRSVEIGLPLLKKKLKSLLAA